MKKVLVTGGCGYIGSHTIIDLIDNGYEVISVDNFLNSNAEPLAQLEVITGKQIKNYEVDLRDFAATKSIFEENTDIAGIIHFAALKSVGDSVTQPLWYFENNLNSLINILKCAKEFNIENVIFSSSCSVYGNADELPVTEATPRKEAESPYARTKQIGEDMIADFSKNNPNIRTIALRYFNPCGAHESGRIGESPINKASNLVPVITETAIGNRKAMTVFGSDYDTRDGSCVRDYIHVMDLANAHTKSFEYLDAGKNESNYEIFNVGIGEGATVLEVINAFEKVAGMKLAYEIGPRRAGDVVAIYSEITKSSTKLGWTPKRSIEDIMRTAWTWEKARQVPSKA